MYLGVKRVTASKFFYVEITLGDLRALLPHQEEIYVQKVLFLANGMVKLHGFGKEKAIALAQKMANDWFNNNGMYLPEKPPCNGA